MENVVLDPVTLFLTRISESLLTRRAVADALCHALNKTCSDLDVFIVTKKIMERNQSDEWILLSKSKTNRKLSSYAPSDYRDRKAFVTIIYDFQFYAVPTFDENEPLGVIIFCSSEESKLIVAKWVNILRPAVRLVLLHEYEGRLQKIIGKYTRNALVFPRGSDDMLAYQLLDQAEHITPFWKHISFWRVSRTSQSLQLIAAHNDPPIEDLDLEHIPEWNLPKIRLVSDNPHLFPETVIFPSIILVVPEKHPTPQKERLLISKINNFTKFKVAYKFSLEYKTSRGFHQSVRIFYDDRYVLVKKISNEKENVFREKLQKILQRQTTLEEGYVLIFSINLAFDDAYLVPRGTVDIDTNIPGPFQAFLVLVASATRNVDTRAVMHTHKSLEHAKYSFDLLSRSRFHLRLLTNLLIHFSEAKSTDELWDHLEESLRDLFDTSYFAVLSNRENRLIVTSKSLIKFRDYSLVIPPLNDNVYAQADISKERSPTFHDIENFIKANNIKRLKVYQTAHPDFDGILEPSKYDKVGMAAIPIDVMLTLIVFSPNRWRLRALEEMSLRILSTGLRAALDRLQKHIPANISSLIDNRDEFITLLLSTDSATQFSEKISSAVEGILPNTALLIVAIDRRGRFFSHLASRHLNVPRNDVLMTLSEVSLVQYCWQQKKPIRAVLKNRILNLADGIQLPFHGLLKVENEVLAIPIGHHEDSPPLAILIVAPPEKEDLTPDKVNSVCRLTETMSIWIQHWQSSALRLLGEPIKVYFARLHNSGAVHHFQWLSEIKRVDTYLPPPMTRIFDRDYLNKLNEFLINMQRFTGIDSITIRARDTRDQGRGDFIYLLAKGTKPSASEKISFNSFENVHSYCMVNAHKLEDIFLPSVRNSALLAKLYSNLTYLPERSSTEAELCIPLTNRDFPYFCATLNIEHNSFERLWLYEEVFALIANIIGRELFSEENIKISGERYLRNLAKHYSNMVEHLIQKSADTLARNINKIEELALDTNVPQEFCDLLKELSADANKHAELIENELLEISSEELIKLPLLQNLIIDRIGQLKTRWNYRYVNLEDPISFILKGDDSEYRLAVSAFISYFEKLLIEQANTLEQIGKFRKLSGEEQIGSYNIKCGLRKGDRNLSIDIFNNVEISNTTRNLSKYLFWVAIDEKERDGKGATGLGLMVLGSMFRSINVLPCAYPCLDRETSSLYGEQYKGLWIELRLQGERHV